MQATLLTVPITPPTLSLLVGYMQASGTQICGFLHNGKEIKGKAEYKLYTV